MSNDRSEALLRRLITSVHGTRQEFTAKPQAEYLSTYWPRLHTDTHGWIDWSLPAPLIDRFVCAFDDPYPGARTTWRGEPVRVKRSLVDHSDGTFHPFQVGLVYRTNGRWLTIATAEGTLIVEGFTNEEGSSLIGQVRPGDRLHTPAARLAETAARVVYTPTGMRLG